jgi:serine protease Do
MKRTISLRARMAGIAVAVGLGLVAAGPASATDPTSAGFAPVVAKLLPSVVSVYIRTVGEKSSSAGSGQLQYASKASQGSGFVVDPSGYIVTNRHVIEGAYAITVVMNDGRMLKATLVGKLQRMDLALLKVDVTIPLPAVTFGDSDKMRQGDPVIAIGNPLGLGGSVTAGIVSALNRSISETPFDDYLQVDAAINHGNSGGPLFNAAGELIGVNVAFFSPTDGGGSVGLGFAIPANDLKWVLDQLRTKRKITAGWIAMEVQSVSSDVAAAFGRTDPTGAIVVNLKDDSIAAKAGIRRGDIVLAFGGDPVSDVRALARAVAKTEPGTTATLQVWRNGKTVSVQVPIVLYPGGESINGLDPVIHDAAVAKGQQAPNLGVNLVTLTAAGRQKWGMSANLKGVLIDSVVPFSVADSHNIRPGEVVMTVMDTPVSMPEEVYKAVQGLRAAGANHIAFLVGNDNGMRWVALPFVPAAP